MRHRAVGDTREGAYGGKQLTHVHAHLLGSRFGEWLSCGLDHIFHEIVIDCVHLTLLVTTLGFSLLVNVMYAWCTPSGVARTVNWGNACISDSHSHSNSCQHLGGKEEREEIYICSSRLGLIKMDHHHSGNGRNSQQ